MTPTVEFIGLNVNKFLENNEISVKDTDNASLNNTYFEKMYSFPNGKEYKFSVWKIVCFKTKVYIEDNVSPYQSQISDLHNKCTELQASKERSEAYLNNLVQMAVPASIYWKDVNSVITGSNLAHTKLTGFDRPEEVIGKTDYDFLWKDQANEIIKNDQKIMASKKGLKFEESATLRDGTIHTFFSAKEPLYDKDRHIIGVIGVSVDITELKETQEALKVAKEAAESADNAKTEFIANMSHDIRTPLSGVVGIANILEDELQKPKQKDLAHDLALSGNELLNMLNEILDVVSADHVDTNDLQEGPFDLAHLIQGIYDLEHPSITLKKIEFLTHIDEKIPKVLVSDHKKIHHILLNLIGNSIKFTHKGHVAINVNLIEKQIDKVLLQFQVKDTGKGIPPEDLDKVFDAFFRVTPSYKGLDKGHGIGLHIAQSYVELLGGNIAVESKPNEGSTFSFTLSLKIADKYDVLSPEKTPARSKDTPSTPSSTHIEKETTSANETLPRILIIEDNTIALNVAKTLLSNAKLNPTPAIDGESALELAKTQSFDLILSDVGLPGMSGIEFARELRAFEKAQHKTATPIIGLTAHAEHKVHAECSDAGMNEVIIKPITAERIAYIINKFSLAAAPQNPTPTATPAATPQSSLGENLPDTEAELFEVDTLNIFDIESARKLLGDSGTDLMDMVKINITTIIPEELPLMQKAHQEGDWKTVTDIAHKLKGGFVYIGLTRAATACQYLERYYKAGHSKLLEKLYDQVLKTIEETSTRLESFVH
ncbi:MAG: ATP-binding protein [Gammaproteobacteria bacterium]|nr:ATP-binding protein [Gammaproteobacteria bacterium]